MGSGREECQQIVCTQQQLTCIRTLYAPSYKVPGRVGSGAVHGVRRPHHLPPPMGSTAGLFHRRSFSLPFLVFGLPFCLLSLSSMSVTPTLSPLYLSAPIPTGDAQQDGGWLTVLGLVTTGWVLG